MSGGLGRLECSKSVMHELCTVNFVRLLAFFYLGQLSFAAHEPGPDEAVPVEVPVHVHAASATRTHLPVVDPGLAFVTAMSSTGF